MSKLPPSVTESTGALPSISVCNRHARAQLYVQGAHLASWRPVGESEVLWMSSRSLFAPGKPIRGGVPICFPWFGSHAGRSELPAHGFARLYAWELTQAEDLADGQTRVVLTLRSSTETEAAWPHRFSLDYTVTIGATLDLALTVRNTGESPFTFEEALHTYFDVADVRRIGIEGLSGAAYLDKVAGASKKQDGAILSITAETDRLFSGTNANCTIVDPLLGRHIVVAKQAAANTVVWNPWIDKAARMPDFGDDEWPGMLCIEAANAAEGRVTLAPGASHTMSQQISVARP